MIINISYQNKLYPFDVNPYLSIGTLKLLFLEKFGVDLKNKENLIFIQNGKQIENKEIVKNYKDKHVDIYILQRGGSSFQMPGNQKSLSIFITILYLFFANRGFNNMIGRLIYPEIDDLCDYEVSKEELDAEQNKKNKLQLSFWSIKNDKIKSSYCQRTDSKIYYVDKNQKNFLYIFSYIVYMVALFAIVFGMTMGFFTKSSCGNPKGGFIGVSILFIIIFMIIPMIVPFLPKIINWVIKIYNIIRNWMASKNWIKKLFNMNPPSSNNNNSNNNNKKKDSFPTVFITTIFILILAVIYLLINVNQLTPAIWGWIVILAIIFLCLKWVFAGLFTKLTIKTYNYGFARYGEVKESNWQCNKGSNFVFYLYYLIFGTIIIYYLMNVLYGIQFDFACKRK